MPTEPELPLTGGCFCGSVRFAVDAPLVSAAYCHCTRCQRRTGTAAEASGNVAPGSFRIVEGAELVHVYRPPDDFEEAFCERCGSHLFSRDPDDHERLSIRLGAFDGDPGIRPGSRQYVAYAASWEPIPDDGLPRYDEARP
jgi:hypothetical protein